LLLLPPIWEVATGVRELKKWHVPGDAVFLHHSGQVLNRSWESQGWHLPRGHFESKFFGGGGPSTSWRVRWRFLELSLATKTQRSWSIFEQVPASTFA